MDPAKMELLLLKIRKSEGKITTLNWSQIAEVLSVLDPGWKVEKSVGIVKLYGRHDKSETPEGFYDENQAEVERRHKLLQKDAVTSLPSSPKPNQLYVLDLTEVSFRNKEWEFRFRPWMGAEGWKITTSNGKVIEILPDAYDFGDYFHGYKEMKRTKIQTYRWVPLLTKETDWISQIDKKLGLGAFEKAAPRTREKTGSCPVCFSNIKITENDQKIVLHGYMRPGTGKVKGSCFGVGYVAFELDVKGTKDYLKAVVAPSAMGQKAYFEQLRDGKITKLTLWNGEVVTPTDGLWDHYYKRELSKAEDNAVASEKLEEVYTKIVKHWEVRPLPKEGERHIDWFFKGRGE